MSVLDKKLNVESKHRVPSYFESEDYKQRIYPTYQ